MTSPAKGEGASLAARFAGGPQLFAPDSARQILDCWLAELAPEQAIAIRDRATREGRVSGDADPKHRAASRSGPRKSPRSI